MPSKSSNGVPAFTGVGFKPDSQKGGVLTQVGLILGHVLPLTSIYKHLPSVSFTSWPESVLPKGAVVPLSGCAVCSGLLGPLGSEQWARRGLSCLAWPSTRTHSTLVPGATHPGRRVGSGSPKAPLAPQAWMDTLHAHSQGRCVRNGGLDADSNFSLGGPAMPLKPGFPLSPAAPDTADGQRGGF